MLSHKERIDEFQLKLSRTEKELYEEFQKTEEAALVLEMQQYFAHAKSQARGIRFDNSLWSKIENRLSVWFAEVCAYRNQNENLLRRSKEAILQRNEVLGLQGAKRGLRFPKWQVTSDGRKRLPTTKRLRQCRYAGAIRNICKAASAEPRAPAMSRSGTTANRTI